MNEFDLKGRVAIVTGAARGIGRVYAKAAAAEGAKVVVSDVLDGEEAVEEIRKGGGEAMYVRADVSDEQSVNALARSAYDRYGRVDGLVNNAARVADIRLGGFDEVSVEEWDAVMAVNVKVPWLAARAVYPFMKARGAGKIINLTTSLRNFYQPRNSPYGVTKAAEESETIAECALPIARARPPTPSVRNSPAKASSARARGEMRALNAQSAKAHAAACRRGRAGRELSGPERMAPILFHL